MTKATLKLGVEILEEQLRQARHKLKLAETLSCECCGEIDEEGEFQKNGGRYVDEWCCYACPKCVPASFDIEAADRLIEKLQKMKSKAMGVAEPEKKTTKSVNLEEREDCTLYWGVNDGHLTIWRFPYELMEAQMEEGEEEPDLGYIYGHKRALGEEWGSLTSAIVRTITQEMLDAEDFDN